MKKRFLIIAASLALASTLAGCSSAAQGKQTQDLISLDEAKTAALSASQIDATGASFSTAELSEKNGIPYYEVDFTADGLEYRYAIDAQTGTVIESTSGAAANANAAAASTGTASGAIDEAKAKQIALEHAGVTEGDTSFLWAKLDMDDGVQVYEVEFYVSATNTEYDYEIDASTGAIRSFDHEAENYTHDTTSHSSGTTNNSSGTSSSNATKSEAEIRQIALAKVPGATANDIQLKLDRDDGRLSYEGKIIYQGMEYEFEIDAYSGAIREWDAESVYD
ncbi:MAG: PepSY domain-containing protein [Butyricicoccus sp.]|nr:PepSY domain-containing protein [Butyricicoccus sp.]